MTLIFHGWPQKTIGHLFHATLSFLHHFIAIGEFNWSDSQETPNLGQNRRFFKPCDLEIWRMTIKNNRAPLLCYFKLCAGFRRHWWIQTGVTVRKRPIWVKFDDFFYPYDLEIWRMTLKNNRAPLLCYFKLCKFSLFIAIWSTGNNNAYFSINKDQQRSYRTVITISL